MAFQFSRVSFAKAGYFGSIHSLSMRVRELVRQDGDNRIKYNVNCDWYAENDYGRFPVQPESKYLMDVSAGLLMTNTFRAIIAYSALEEFPNTSKKIILEGSVELSSASASAGRNKGNMKVAPVGNKTTPTGGSFRAAVEFEAASGDVILRNLREVNDNIRTILIEELLSHDIGLKMTNDEVVPTFYTMSSVLTEDATNLAASFGGTVKKVAEDLAISKFRNLGRKIPTLFEFRLKDF